MTTIVIDKKNKKMFADTKLTLDNISATETIKIFKEVLKDGSEVIIGIAGAYLNGLKLKDYLVEVGYPNQDKKLKPNFYDFTNEDPNSSDNDFELVILYKNKKIISYSLNLIPMEIIEDHYCIGSGGDYTKAILIYQKDNNIKIDIISAIKSVSKIDKSTNDKIMVLKL